MSDNENITLEFLAKQQMRILSELAEMRKETARIPLMERDLAELKVGQAALSVDLKITKADVAEIKDTLPLIEGRLVRIEKQLGFVKA